MSDFFEEQRKANEMHYERAISDFNGFITQHFKDITPQDLINTVAMGASHEFWGGSYAGQFAPFIKQVDINFFLNLFEYWTKKDPHSFIRKAFELNGMSFDENCLETHTTSEHRDQMFIMGVQQHTTDFKALNQQVNAVILSAHLYFTSKSQSLVTCIDDYTYFEGENSVSACPNGAVLKEYQHGITYRFDRKANKIKGD
ncbi:hypothetical protein L2755_21940 [Shewanella abyssi]|uniref:hypothetical protein n=1 Tax=Shewanella abyssi TaxID=311789 RepID=UPI0020109ADD|nr:hypothetical protein [Shewanella abyssi]MCL1052245.1 hypothetical protein [Shewanella abyssi]